MHGRHLHQRAVLAQQHGHHPCALDHAASAYGDQRVSIQHARLDGGLLDALRRRAFGDAAEDARDAAVGQRLDPPCQVGALMHAAPAQDQRARRAGSLQFARQLGQRVVSRMDSQRVVASVKVVGDGIGLMHI